MSNKNAKSWGLGGGESERNGEDTGLLPWQEGSYDSEKLLGGTESNPASWGFNSDKEFVDENKVGFGQGPDLGFGGELYTKDLKGIDFSESFRDFDIAASFGAAAPSASRPAPSPPVAPSNGDYVFDNDATSVRSQFSKNLFGGNLDVITALEAITFDPGVDGSLRNSIAYIQPWTRTATSGKTEASASPDSVPVDTSLSDAMSGIWNNVDILNNPDLPSINFGLLEGIDTGFVPSFNSDSGIWEQADYNYYTDTDFSAFSDFKGKLSTSDLYSRFSEDTDNANNASTDTSAAEQKQTSLKKDTAVGFRPSGLLQGLFNAQGGGFNIGTIGKALTGPVFAGNPSGNVLSQVGSLLNSFGAGSSTSRDLSSKQPKSSSLSSAPISASSGKWQFLFNPSQLTLSVGPNFKAAETWGVGDEPNAGQPLHWTSMKNPELKFSKVLLNGYVFGRRVEELEQGLIKLFMENPTNDAKHGPKVLEFVWGKKTFGPCVIKDIRINQKMWDEGLLVNAEVDFTLVRVPEWTINDGYVSTYDPSAQNTIIEPKAAPKAASSVGVGSSPPNNSDQPQPSPSRPTPKPTDFKKCGIIKTGLDNVSQLISNGDYYKKRVLDFGKAQFLGSSFFGEPGMDPDVGISKMSSQYVNWNSRTNVGGMIPAGTSGCGIPSLNKEKEKISRLPDYVGAGASRAQNSKKMRDAVALIGKYQKCIKERDVILKKKYKEDCSSGGMQSIDPNAPAYIPPGT